jgi:MFS family permease
MMCNFMKNHETHFLESFVKYPCDIIQYIVMRIKWGASTTALAIAIKTLVSLAMRFGGFYAPFLAPHYRSTTDQFLQAIGIGTLGAIASSLLSPFFDALSPQLLFVVGECLVVIGLGLAALSTSVTIGAGLAWCLLLAGTCIVTAAVQSILTISVPSEELGKLTSYIETSWSLAGIIGIPGIGFILAVQTVPILMLINICLHVPLALLMGWQFYALVDHDASPQTISVELSGVSSATAESPNPNPNQGEPSITTAPVKVQVAPAPALTMSQIMSEYRANFAVIFGNRRQLAILFLSVCIAWTSYLTAASFGQWLQITYGYEADSVGYFTFLFGGGELIGAALVGLFADKYGLLQSVLLSCLLFSLSQFGIAVAQLGGFIPALCVLCLNNIISEFCIVSSISFASSEGGVIVGTLMSLFFSATFVGSMLASLTAAPLFEAFRFAGVVITGGCSVAAAGFVLKLAVSGQTESLENTVPSPVPTEETQTVDIVHEQT